MKIEVEGDIDELRIYIGEFLVDADNEYPKAPINSGKV